MSWIFRFVLRIKMRVNFKPKLCLINFESYCVILTIRLIKTVRKIFWHMDPINLVYFYQLKHLVISRLFFYYRSQI